MRYLSLLAAILASTPVCAAEFTDTIKIPPGFTERWQAPRPFKFVIIGNPEIVDAQPVDTDQALIITMKKLESGAEGSVTNIVLVDGHGEQVANVLVTSPREPPAVTHPHTVAWSTKTGAWQVYRKDDECYSFCVSIETKPNDPAPTPAIVEPYAAGAQAEPAVTSAPGVHSHRRANDPVP